MRYERESENDKKKKKKQKDSWLEKEIFAFIQKSAEAAIKAAMDDVFKDFK